MTIIVQDAGFQADDWTGAVLELAGDDLPADWTQVLAAPLVRIRFPAFSDGRGFTLARALRAQGFRGRLRAAGPLLPDQYAMLRRTGFDEVELTAEHAASHPESAWLVRADWQAHDYRSRLAG
ncbi:DUF934 domain-containing protein [Paracoccus sp. p4-l81]|uniref:DUF934 domain-containing protein n=1 Tax=unclassified Paracoccus (in: a-proteobacteria) TaxID=2688777 RepID=UPI0035BA2A9A